MKRLNSYISLFLIASFYSTVSCVWILVPQHDASCRTKYFNAANVADAAEQGCFSHELTRNSRLGKFMLKKGLLLSRRYRGPDFQSEYPIYEMNLRFRSSHAHVRRQSSRFKIGRKPDYKVTFAWNESGNICIPLGLIGYDDTGREYACESQPVSPGRNAEFTRDMLEPAVEEVVYD